MNDVDETQVASKPSEIQDKTRRLPIFTMIAWGIGTLGPVTVLTATNTLLLRFMTDIYGLGAAVAASLIAGSKLYDVFADVGMGIISDNTRSRWGRRRPYLIFGAVVLAVSLLAIFGAPAFPKEQTRFWYMAAILVFYATAYSIFNIPYMAMAGEMTRNYHERTNLMSWRVYAVGLSIMIATFVGPLLLDAFGSGAQAYVGMALVFAPIVILAGIVTFMGTAKAPTTIKPKARYTLAEQISSGLSNRPFVALVLIKFVTLMSLGTQSIFPYFFQRILGVPNTLLGTYFLCQSAMMLLTPALWLALSRWIGKKATFMIALSLAVPTWLSWLLAVHGEPMYLLFVRAAVIGSSGAGVILMGQSMLPDTMEYDFRRTGMRREGIFAAFYTTVEKISGAIGVALVGGFLGAYGYVQSRGITVEQPASALWAIRILMSAVPAGITILGMIVLLFYNLDEKKLMASVETQVQS